ncbi:MAG: Macrolide export protein MacA [Pseudomonadota bacterium]
MKTPTPAPNTPAIDQLLGTPPPAPWWRRRAVGVGLLVLLLGVGVYVWQSEQTPRDAPSYQTEPLGRGDITLTVSANGTLQPTRAVNIGSELSGTVRRVLVDVNDRVKAGQVLVELDAAKLNDQVQAGLAVAQAQLAVASATLRESRANWARLQDMARLSGGQFPSASELDVARAALERAEASEASASANISSARASLSTDETNLAKASIRSPIDGVVLSRSVDPGNAVAASLQAVTLFSVAEDLSKLRLDVNVDEADVGNIQAGQRASFTVSAYPARRYPANLRRVAFGSTRADNVVTYIGTLDVDNRDLSLRPGMTASANIVAQERQNVLRVPNSALRFTPASSSTEATGSRNTVMSALFPRMPSTGAPRRATEANPGAPRQRQIWLLQDGQPVAQTVQTGISDGRFTEISGEGLREGQAVITHQLSTGNRPAKAP